MNRQSEELLTIRSYGLFLKDYKKVIEQLPKLEKLLFNAAQAKNLLDENKNFKNYIDGRPFKHDKLLSNCLSSWAQENDFQKPIKLETVQSPDTFFNTLRSKCLFKDKAFGGLLHGEWTHYIQWFCIVERHKDQPFSSLHPSTIYEWLGRTNNEKEWFRNFEGADELTIQTDFRYVGDLNNYLLNTECLTLFPILHQLIKGRAMKREEEKNEQNNNHSISKTSGIKN